MHIYVFHIGFKTLKTAKSVTKLLPYYQIFTCMVFQYFKAINIIPNKVIMCLFWQARYPYFI